MDIDEITVSNSKFNNMCRTCLCVDDIETLASVFDVQYNEKSFIEILNVCTTVQISEEDKLPLQICTKCISDAIRSYDFKIQCEQADIKLKQTLDDYNTVKEEYEELVEQYSDGICSDSSLTKNESTENETKQSQTKAKVKARKVAGTPYECCSDKFDTCAKYISHRKNKQHPKIRRDQTCVYCKKSFSYTQLRLPLRSEEKRRREKPYKCEICLRWFSFKNNLRRHMMTHTGEKPHKCSKCGKGFIQAVSLKEHMRIHNNEKYICSYCGKNLKHLATLKNHIKFHQMENGKLSKEVQRNHVCSVCNRFFMTKTILKDHMLTHSTKSYLCTHCGKAFARPSQLKSHSKVHTGHKPYSCNVCFKKFSHVGTLKSHSLIHSGEKPFTCQLCGKSFTQPSHLKNHQRIHTGEKPYECSVCGKRFAINGNLTVHKRTHTGETPYVCLVCGKGFYNSSSMKKHKKGHGKIEVGDANDKKDVTGASTKPII